MNDCYEGALQFAFAFMFAAVRGVSVLILQRSYFVRHGLVEQLVSWPSVTACSTLVRRQHPSQCCTAPCSSAVSREHTASHLAWRCYFVVYA